MYSKALFNIIIISFVLCLFTSCSDPADALNEPEFQFDVPVVTGLFITSAEGPEIIATWRNPSSNNSGGTTQVNNEPGLVVSMNYRLYVPYPNPTNVSCCIHFTVPRLSHVKIYLVPAQLEQSFPDNSENILSGIYSKPGSISVITLIDNNLNAGSYLCTLDGNQLPDGFYRVYMKVGEERLWHDILIAKDSSIIPEEIKKMNPWRVEQY
jgi:hypothetical protein